MGRRYSGTGRRLVRASGRQESPYERTKDSLKPKFPRGALRDGDVVLPEDVSVKPRYGQSKSKVKIEASKNV